MKTSNLKLTLVKWPYCSNCNGTGWIYTDTLLYKCFCGLADKP